VELPLPSRVVIAVLLVVAYAFYVRRILASGGKMEEVPGRLSLLRANLRAVSRPMPLEAPIRTTT
jgi:hypothetical protein